MTKTVFLLLFTAVFLADAVRAQSLSPEEREEASALYKKFTAAKADLPARTKIVAEMAEMGSTVAKVIHPIIDREFRTVIARYRTDFLTQAKKVASSKTSREKRERISKLRAAAQGLRSKSGLSKGDVKSIGDPAVAELRKLTGLEAAEVLVSSEKLAAARRDLIELAAQRAITIDELVLIELDEFGKGDLEAEEKEVAGSAMNIDSDARKILELNRELASEVEPAEAEGIADLNELRILIGLRPCLIDPKLCAAARGHSEDMKEKDFFSHSSPVPGKKSFTTRAKLEGTSANSENIYVGSSSGKSANKGWWYSPGHHKNMLSPGARRVGMGVAGKHWTQMFGG